MSIEERLIAAEERLTIVEGRLEKIKPIVKRQTKTLRDLRAVAICASFIATLGILSLDGIRYSKSDGWSLGMGSIKIEAIGVGLVLVSLLVDQDTGQAKIVDKAIQRILGK